MPEDRDNFSEIENATLSLRKETTLVNLEAVLQHFSFEVLVKKFWMTKKVLNLK